MKNLTTNQVTARILNKFQTLCQDSTFIQMSAIAAEKMGVTAEEWNKKKSFYLMNFAIEMLEREWKENGVK